MKFQADESALLKTASGLQDPKQFRPRRQPYFRSVPLNIKHTVPTPTPHSRVLSCPTEPEGFGGRAGGPASPLGGQWGGVGGGEAERVQVGQSIGRPEAGRGIRGAETSK